MNIYCGNNQLDPEIVNGTSEIGTRHTCLRKGIGVGLNLPYDEKYRGDYQAIDNTRIYCGNQEILPNGYDRFGNISQCLQKGVALGKRQKALRDPPNPTTQVLKKNFKYIIFILLCTSVFLLMYFLKPFFIIRYDENNNKIIIWEKFILYYLIFCFVIFYIKFNFIFI
jgi:hypothetical protein